ncbi:MAG: hypothetical protein H0Z34_12785 [Brevibacillus sp.]|nr:hypothetical protein [Brevibacillus sp.]
MGNVWSFFDKMNLFAWVLGIFGAHVLLYLLLGTAAWLATSFLAASVYAVALLALKLLARRYVGNQEKDKIS